jgi:hypothetical protein
MIGGPALWLALACALGTGLMSREVEKRVVAYLGLESLDLLSVYDNINTAAAPMLGLGGLWFLLVWRLLAWRCRSEPDYPRWRRSLLLIYVSASACFTLNISAWFLQAWSSPSDTLFPICAAYFLSSIGIGALLFAVRNPVDGFFCAGFSCLMLFQFFGEPGGADIHPGYFATAAMGIAFAYVYGGFWSHLALGCLGLTPIAFVLFSAWKQSLPITVLVGFLLLHGAIIGSVIWLIRKGIQRMRKRGRAEAPHGVGD